MNDDSIRAIDLILNELADAVAIGKTMVPVHQEPAQRPKRTRSRRSVTARAEAEEPQEAAVAESQSTETVKAVDPVTQKDKVQQPESLQ